MSSIPSQIIAITTIAEASRNVINIIADIEKAKNEAKAIYAEVTAYMDSFLANNKLTGSQKKEIVIQLIKDTWNTIVKDFPAFSDTVEKWIDRISNFIDLVYSVYKKGIELANSFRDKFQ